MSRRFSPQRLSFLFQHEEVSIREVAIKLSLEMKGGISSSVLGIERHIGGKAIPDARALAAYADYFGVPVDFFFDTV